MGFQQGLSGLNATSKNLEVIGHNVANANTYGGCFGPRFTRIVGTQLGSLSRHTWAQALDTNTTSNCQGCVPKMDCRIVRIFRKHNFAWGGNFINPDGMHFEWANERRDIAASDSDRSGYCLGANAPRTYESATVGVASVPPAPSPLDVLYPPDAGDS